MRFSGNDELLAMSVIRADAVGDLDVFVVTDGGYAKRTPVTDYRVQGRGGLGVLAARVVDDRGSLVGALVVNENDEALAITSGGGVIRTRVADVRRTGRTTMGVRLINLGPGNSVVGIARNAETVADAVVAALEPLDDADIPPETPGDGAGLVDEAVGPLPAVVDVPDEADEVEEPVDGLDSTPGATVDPDVTGDDAARDATQEDQS